MGRPRISQCHLEIRSLLLRLKSMQVAILQPLIRQAHAIMHAMHEGSHVGRMRQARLAA